MNQVATFTRPALDVALESWSKLLADRGYAAEQLWIFEENLCFERSSDPGGFHPGFQLRFTPAPDDALPIAYEHFCETESPIVFYRLGENRGRSVCLLLCDPWFAAKADADGYVRREDWRLAFHPGHNRDIEEVADMARWLRRIRRERPLHDVDFCMTLEAIDEIKIHGRVLAPYERFADQMVGKLRRLFRHAD